MSVATARILLLANYRPEYQHAWGTKTYFAQLRLDPLGKREAEEFLTALLEERAGAQHVAPLRQFILDKTEGNPFFMEEIVQALVEEGVLTDPRRVGTAHRDVGVHGHAPLPTDLHIPPTVQAVLASRIDRLPPEEKELLQTLCGRARARRQKLARCWRKSTAGSPKDLTRKICKRPRRC